MNTKRLRKMALYLKYLAFLLDEECTEYENRTDGRKTKRAKSKRPDSDRMNCGEPGEPQRRLRESEIARPNTNRGKGRHLPIDPRINARKVE